MLTVCCKKCNQDKPISDFYLSLITQKICKSCSNHKTYEYRRNNNDTASKALHIFRIECKYYRLGLIKFSIKQLRRLISTCNINEDPRIIIWKPIVNNEIKIDNIAIVNTQLAKKLRKIDVDFRPTAINFDIASKIDQQHIEIDNDELTEHSLADDQHRVIYEFI